MQAIPALLSLRSLLTLVSGMQGQWINIRFPYPGSHVAAVKKETVLPKIGITASHGNNSEALSEKPACSPRAFVACASGRSQKIRKIIRSGRKLLGAAKFCGI